MSRIQERSLRIAIATSGRFHVCDLARELSALGHEVKFYSLVPPKRTKQFGLPSDCNRWLLPRVAWVALRARMARTAASRQHAFERLAIAFDNAVSRAIEPCDVFIGMSGMSNRAGVAARQRFGSAVWIERGSRHILSQQEILCRIPGAEELSKTSIERELHDYDQADCVSLLSKHCEESFLERGVPSTKLFRNPLGVNLKHFRSTNAPAFPPTVIMTGTWCLRKGCDVLMEAWRKLSGVRLIHVGSVGDYPLPKNEGFTHYDKVNQPELLRFYEQAHVFALASREEGLATVQPQAISCGLRLVCTTRTGGEDLKQFVSEPSCIQVIPPDDPNELAQALTRSIDACKYEIGTRDRLTDASRQELSWQGYGRRYHDELMRRLVVNR
jgi:alpha-maltose-1-phosphate synthase